MALRIGGSAESARYQPGGRNYRGPILGQQQQSSPLQLQYSIPMGGFMGQNQIGGQSGINVYKRPPAPLTPEEEEEQRLEERAAQYQKGVGEFNLGQKEAELEKRIAEAEEIASGKFMLDGQAVSREGMNQYHQNEAERVAKVRADNPIDPFYARARQYVAQNIPSPRPIAPGESQEQFQRRMESYAKNTAVQAQNVTQRVYNQMKENALIRSIEQFRDDPTAYLMGGGMSGQRTNTIAPDELMNYLGKANQMFQLTGGEGNFIDNLLGRNPEGTVQKRVVTPLNRLLPGKRSADELADFEYSRFLKNNTITSSKGTRNITEKDKTKFLQSLLGRIPN